MDTPARTTPLLRVTDLHTRFVNRGRMLRAVDGVSLDVLRGRTLGLVGESGCGKSTLARTILRLLPASSGHVEFEGLDLLALPRRALRPIRRRMQVVFQDPAGSLSPRLKVESLVGEALEVHGLARTRSQRRARVADWLQRVGLAPADLDRYPHEFSGGQRQRICIARALALDPSLVICDEPVAALDVSVQAQILNLLSDLQQQFGIGYLFISHDLAVVRHISDEIAVMYLGRIIEQGPADVVLANPGHPYTHTLRAAQLELDLDAPSTTGILPLRGLAPPDPLDPPRGCGFHPRCPLAQPRCRVEVPRLQEHPGLAPRHLVACHLAPVTCAAAIKPP